MTIPSEAVRHRCDGQLPMDGYGAAIESCESHEDGTLWTGNTRVGSQIVKVEEPKGGK